MKSSQQVTDAGVVEALVSLAAQKNKSLSELTDADVQSDRFVSAILDRRSEPMGVLARMVRDQLISKIDNGVRV